MKMSSPAVEKNKEKGGHNASSSNEVPRSNAENVLSKRDQNKNSEQRERTWSSEIRGNVDGGAVRESDEDGGRRFTRVKTREEVYAERATR